MGQRAYLAHKKENGLLGKPGGRKRKAKGGRKRSGGGGKRARTRK